MGKEWQAEWHPERDLAWLSTVDGENSGQLYVTEWYPSKSRDKGFAWVASKLDADSETPLTVAREVEFPAAAADTPQRRDELVRLASAALNSGPTELLVTSPRRAPLTPSEWYSLVDLQIHAWDGAQTRLHDACRSREEWELDLIFIALSETLSWTYTVDESLQRWWKALKFETREELSLRMDKRIEHLIASDRSPFTEESVKTDRHLEGYRDRLNTGEPYGRWCDISRSGWFSRQTSRALSWVRGQLTHTAIAEPVHLIQFREGAEPRWKWAHSSEFVRSKEDKNGAHAYNRELAGGDVLGLFPHFLTEFWDARSDLFRAMRAEVGEE